MVAEMQLVSSCYVHTFHSFYINRIESVGVSIDLTNPHKIINLNLYYQIINSQNRYEHI